LAAMLPEEGCGLIAQGDLRPAASQSAMRPG
jgi:hypothetical protein